MARVFDRKVGMFFLPFEAHFAALKKKNPNLGLHAPVFVYLECSLLIRRNEKKANAEEVIYSLTGAPLTSLRKPSETKQNGT